MKKCPLKHHKFMGLAKESEALEALEAVKSL